MGQQVLATLYANTDKKGSSAALRLNKIDKVTGAAIGEYRWIGELSFPNDAASALIMHIPRTTVELYTDKDFKGKKRVITSTIPNFKNLKIDFKFTDTFHININRLNDILNINDKVSSIRIIEPPAPTSTLLKGIAHLDSKNKNKTYGVIKGKIPKLTMAKEGGMQEVFYKFIFKEAYEKKRSADQDLSIRISHDTRSAPDIYLEFDLFAGDIICMGTKKNSTTRKYYDFVIICTKTVDNVTNITLSGANGETDFDINWAGRLIPSSLSTMNQQHISKYQRTDPNKTYNLLCGPTNNNWACPAPYCCSSAGICGGTSGIQDNTYCTVQNQTGYYTGITSGMYDSTNPPTNLSQLYIDNNYQGGYDSLKIGNYDTLGFLDKKISSLKIPSGLKAALYSEPGFAGSLLYQTNKDTPQLNATINDQASSVRILADAASVPAARPVSQVRFQTSGITNAQDPHPTSANSCSVYYTSLTAECDNGDFSLSTPELQAKYANDTQKLQTIVNEKANLPDSINGICKLNLHGWKRPAGAPTINAAEPGLANRGDPTTWAFCFQEIKDMNLFPNAYNNINTDSMQLNPTVINGLDGDNISYARLAFKKLDQSASGYNAMKNDICKSTNVPNPVNLFPSRLFGIDVNITVDNGAITPSDPKQIMITDVGVYVWNNGTYVKDTGDINSQLDIYNALFTAPTKKQSDAKINFSKKVVFNTKQTNATVYVFGKDFCDNKYLLRTATGVFGINDYLYDSNNNKLESEFSLVDHCSGFINICGSSDLTSQNTLNIRANKIASSINSMKNKPLQSNLLYANFPISLITLADKRIYMSFS